MDPRLFIAAALVIWVVVVAIMDALAKRKVEARLEQEKEAEIAFVQTTLGGLDPKANSKQIIKMLEDTLPAGYRCGKGGCNGLLVKSARTPEYYRCTRCGNLRTTIRVKSLT